MQENSNCLHLLSPSLCAAFSKAPCDLRRAAAIAACQAGVRQAGLKSLVALLEAIRGGWEPSVEALAQVSALAQRLDEEYFDLAERGADYIPRFSQARAASAVANLLGEDWDDAIYEAAHAFEDHGQVVALVEQTLAGKWSLPSESSGGA